MRNLPRCQFYRLLNGSDRPLFFGRSLSVFCDNYIVALLRGDYRLVELLSNASWIDISIISAIALNKLQMLSASKSGFEVWLSKC
ncbi:MAG: hypothetical protein ACFE0I_13755 [Elainellaceae cyanobacterium]